MADRKHSLIDADSDDNKLRTFIMFIQTANMVRKYADTNFYRKADLSVIKFIVMQALDINGGTMTATEIASWTFTERHNVTTLVTRLKQDGLVRTERPKRDKRFVNVTLTAKGLKVCKQVTPVAKEIVNQVMLSFSERDIILIESSLRILRQNAYDGLEYVSKLAHHRPS